ncbi:MAG TPA: ATP-binding cassette domain-containing protein [Anaerolineales bacterium]|nr:ATP-binding cassette domain-containing protein [Anaerolineales bacterium]
MIIKVEHLTKSFDYYKKELGLRNSIKNLFFREKLTKTAVNDISFEIEAGEVVGFLGPNGAGKTTTLKMLSGILHPTGGKASVLGFTPWERRKAFKMQFAIVMGQKNQLWWDLPANESLFLNKCIYEIDDRTYESTLAELTELLDVKGLLDVQVRRLSLGERMKMELIAALIHKPKLIFLDEPTIGLDLISQKKFRDFFKYYNQEKKATILLTSHYMEDVEDLCKRVVIINQGRIVFDGDLQKVNEVFAQSKVIKLQLSERVGREALAAFGKVREQGEFSATLEVPRQELKKISKAMLDRLPVLDFTIEDIPVEEGIALMYQRQEAV